MSKSAFAALGVCGLFILACSAGGQSGAAAQEAASAGVGPVTRAEIIDRNGFEKPMVATTVLLPAGWTHEGGLVWKQGPACGAPYDISFRARSPDGRSGVEIIPQEQWYWTNMPVAGAQDPCPQAQVGSVQDYLASVVSRMRPGARIVDFRRRPDVEERYKQFLQQSNYPGSQMRSWAEAGEALIAYADNGVDMRETIGSVVMFTQMSFDGMIGMAPMQMLSATTMPGFSMRAPNGQLDFKLAEMIRTSAKDDPQWSARMAKYYENVRRINAKGSSDAIRSTADRSRIISQTNNDIMQMQMDGWRSRNASSDRMQRETVESIRGVETYNDPYNGGTVQLDNTYDNAWQLNDGGYVLSNDAGFDPNVDLGVDAQRLEVAE
ncbi:MAG: hypothetical protein R3C58_04095 [Parvularculaceae bacterium]